MLQLQARNGKHISIDLVRNRKDEKIIELVTLGTVGNAEYTYMNLAQFQVFMREAQYVLDRAMVQE